MANTLLVPEDIEGSYGATHNDEDFVVPFRTPSSSWKPKKVVVVLGLMGVLSAVVVLWSVLQKDASSAGPSAARTGPEAVLLRFYPYVTITNKTPYAVRKYRRPNQASLAVSYFLCTADYYPYDGLPAKQVSLPAGQTWSASSRGLCLVTRVYATLYRPMERPWMPNQLDPSITCATYSSTGTSHSIYSILMKGDDACCVRSSHELQECD